MDARNVLDIMESDTALQVLEAGRTTAGLQQLSPAHARLWWELQESLRES